MAFYFISIYVYRVQHACKRSALLNIFNPVLSKPPSLPPAGWAGTRWTAASVSLVTDRAPSLPWSRLRDTMGTHKSWASLRSAQGYLYNRDRSSVQFNKHKAEPQITAVKDKILQVITKKKGWSKQGAVGSLREISFGDREESHRKKRALESTWGRQRRALSYRQWTNGEGPTL